jgi:hypothetical protein
LSFDINPRVVGGLDGYQDNIEVTWALGEEIGREVVRVYRTLQPEPMTTSLQVATEDIRLPRTYRELVDDFKHTAVHAPTTAVRMGDLLADVSDLELYPRSVGGARCTRVAVAFSSPPRLRGRIAIVFSATSGTILIHRTTIGHKGAHSVSICSLRSSMTAIIINNLQATNGPRTSVYLCAYPADER